MKKKAWKTRTKKACIEAGTYKPYFDYVIDALARILEKRDQIQEVIDSGEEELIIETTNKSGFTNRVINPLFKTWKEINEQAISYWRELGLTPAGLKKINDEAFQKEKSRKATNNLMEMLEESRRLKGK